MKQNIYQVGYLIICICCWLLLNNTSIFAQSENAQLQYRFEPGKLLTYEFSGTAKIDESEDMFNGRIQLNANAKNVSKNLSGSPLEVQARGFATSTAFGVSSDGYMLTCAHCVEGAENLSVTTPDGKLPAQIVSTNKELDLAIIKVETKNLPTIPLAKTKQVPLGEEVRAIGFPLSDVLGNSVKISQGMVSGLIQNEFGNAYQIDAAVNPGNSGGPLVDERGNVVGVVNAKLDGITISKIGFSVPIKYACQMLDEQKVVYSSETKTKTLTGPILAKTVTPAVFFVEAELGPEGYQSHSNFEVSGVGYVEHNGKQDIFHGRAIVGRYGGLIDSADNEFIPYIFDSVLELPIEILPPSVINQWGDNQLVTLQLPGPPTRDRDNIYDPFGGSLGGGLFDRYGRTNPYDPFSRLSPRRRRTPERSTETVKGERKVSYEIKSRKGHLVNIERLESLRTIQDDSYSSLKFVNQRKLVFDAKKGAFVECSMTGKLTSTIGDETVEFPVNLSYELIQDESLKSDNVAREAPKNREAQNLTTEKLLEKFAAQDEMKNVEVLRILNLLGEQELNAKELEKTVEAVKSKASDSSSAMRKSAIKALMVLDKRQAVPFVAKELANSDRFSRRSWITKLAETGEAEAAIYLCREIERPGSSKACRKALINMGNVAEQPVTELLARKYSNAKLTVTLLEVLDEIGTELSREKLTEISSRSDWNNDKKVNALLKQILNEN